MPVRIAALSGSMRAESTSLRALRVACRGAEEAGAQVDMIDLRTLNLPLYDAREDEESYPHAVHEFRRRMGAADGFLVCSPEYHGSYPGALKNAFDFLYTSHVEGKVAGIVGTAGSRYGATSTINAIGHLMRWLKCWTLPVTGMVAAAEHAFDPNGDLKDPTTQERLLAVGRALAQSAPLFRQMPRA